MSRKGQSITLSVSERDKAELEAIARELGMLWGERPNISKLVEAIARRQLLIAPNNDWTEPRLKALTQAVLTPARPGLYAVRNKDDGLLYIGKAKSLRGRFSGGHKAFLWAWLDKYNDEDVRIATYPLPHWGNPALLLELEAAILRATEPPYNVKIPMES